MSAGRHLSRAELLAGLEDILAAPKNHGALQLIVRRPEVNAREVIASGYLDELNGLAGDSWRQRGSRHMPEGQADPQMQLTIMNARVARLVAGNEERVPLAGDQLYLDFDLSPDNLPPGSRLQLGDAIIEITPPAHTGCKKFAERFGRAAVVFVNSGPGRKMNFRGVNAKIIRGGMVQVGDLAKKKT